MKNKKILTKKNKKNNLFYETKGFCSVCRKLVPAEVVEKDDSMIIIKTCLKHGKSEGKVAKHAWYFKGLYNFYENLYGKNYNKKRENLYFLSDVNSKCNIKCNICYAGTVSQNFKGCPKLKEISKSFFKKQLAKIKNKGKVIRFIGGEPTLREDLPELIRLVSRSGNVSDIATNGIKIANNINYLKTLKKSGLGSVMMWVDTFKNKEISEKMRGGNFISHKLKALNNLKTLGVSTNVLEVIIKNFNEREVKDIFEYARRNKFVSRLRIHGYKHMGKAYFSSKQEFLFDELTEAIVKQLPKVFTLKEIYCFQKLVYALSAINRIPVCPLNQNFIVPRRGSFKVFNFKKLSKALDKFEKIWINNKKLAKAYLFTNLRSILGKYFPILENNFHNLFFSENFLEITIGCCFNLSNFDERIIKQQCMASSFNLGPGTDLEKNISRCEENIRLHSIVKGGNIN